MIKPVRRHGDISKYGLSGLRERRNVSTLFVPARSAVHFTRLLCLACMHANKLAMLHADLITSDLGHIASSQATPVASCI